MTREPHSTVGAELDALPTTPQLAVVEPPHRKPPTPNPTTLQGAERFTDAALAEQLVTDALAGSFRWVAGLNWLTWDGRRWASCPEPVVVECARQWATAQVQYASLDFRAGQDSDGTALKSWLAVARSAGRLRGIVGLAKGVEGVLTDVAAFDAHPDLLNVANGVVDLRTGELRPHDPALLMTKLAPVPYVPSARHRDWTAALDALPDEVRAWMHVRLGQAVTGYMTPDDVLPVCQGGGENGKTTVFVGVTRALGDYYTLVSDRVLLADPSAHPTELMELRGARLALIEETPEARRLSVARLKKTVGAPQITARHIRKDTVTYDATHSLFVTSNYRPVVEETDHGTWRRLALVTFPYTFRKPGEALSAPGDRPGDPNLRQRIEHGRDGQHSAVLTWLVDGARAWYANKRVIPAPPARVVEDTRAWRGESDLVLAYADDRLVFESGVHVMTTELLADFNAWLVEHGHRAWSDRKFAARFGEHHDVAVELGRHYATDPGLSRRSVTTPTAGFPAMPTSPLPARYRAWDGVRFRLDTDETPNGGAQP